MAHFLILGESRPLYNMVRGQPLHSNRTCKMAGNGSQQNLARSLTEAIGRAINDTLASTNVRTVQVSVYVLTTLKVYKARNSSNT